MNEVTRVERKFNDILDVIRNLTDILTTENIALKSHKLNGLSEVVEKKISLGKIYEKQMQYISTNPDIFSILEKNKKEILKTSTNHLSNAMEENDSLLRSNIDSGKRLLKAFVDAAKKRQVKNTTYSKEGGMNLKTQKAAPVAFSYNQTI